MLKLTNSFCRYLKLTDNIVYNRVHVNISEGLQKKCSTYCGQTNLDPQFRLLANKKKREHLKYTNEKRIFKPMSESMQPTLNNVSVGGQFEVSEANSKDESDGANADNNTESKQTCTIPPDFRVWESTAKSTPGAFQFKIVSYNVLAQYLLECHPYLYTDCAPHNLKWKVRAPRLYNEIMNLAPDIICLQEVQASHLQSFYSKFQEAGYVGVYKQKTGDRYDGCAIYFRQSMFEMKDHISVEFYQPEMPILNRDNIGVIVKLVPHCSPGIPIVVATTHLLYNPKRTDVRLAQMQVFLAEIDRFAYYDNGTECGYYPIILTGDFNSTPDSAVIKLLDRGHVSASRFRDSSDWQKIGVTDNCQHISVMLNRQNHQSTDYNMIKIHHTDLQTPTTQNDYADCQSVDIRYSSMFNTGSLAYPLNLKSVYNTYKPDGSYEATTFADYWTTVDYIYFSYCSVLKLVERLRLPTAMECNVLQRLPNDVYASDHLALAATFEMKNPAPKANM